MLTAVLAVILFAVMIFPHELGHFLSAKALGVKVNEFAFGMGPALWKRQKGETLYAIRLFPVGGYCAMEGKDTESGASDHERSFTAKPAWAKIVILASGAAMNVLICMLALTILSVGAGQASTTLAQVEAGSPAYTAGLRPGDRIMKVNNAKITEWSDVGSAFLRYRASDGRVNIVYERDQVRRRTAVTPRKEEGRWMIGIRPVIRHSVLSGIENGVKGTGAVTAGMLHALKQLVTGRMGADSLSGPVGMVSLVHRTESLGIWYFLYLLALISMNLAIINLLPLPALDGGRIIFVIVRKITGKLISDRTEAMVHAAGLMFFLALTVVITWKDILRLMG